MSGRRPDTPTSGPAAKPTTGCPEQLTEQLTDQLTERLRAAGCVFAEQEADLLRARASGDALERLVLQRLAGHPLEQVLGEVQFAGTRVLLDSGVFVPRRRTGLLVALAAEHARAGGTAVDLCCGSGAVGAALAARRPDLQVHAADVDPTAVACARRNLPRVHLGDLWDALPQGLLADVVTVNAPYVPTSALATLPPEARDHEPRLALDGGPDGLALHRRIAAGAPARLRPGAVLVLETSTVQAAASRQALQAAGLVARVVQDDDLGATAVIATYPNRISASS